MNQNPPAEAPDTGNDWVGRTILHYEVAELIGRGGMGAVYKAKDRRLERWVAIKALLPSVAGPDRIARFAQEARAASALNHPNILTIYEIGKTPSGADFMVMEFVEGKTLRSIAARPPAAQEVLAIGRQVAQALAVAHGRGIVHRDIKPENLVLRPDGYVKLLDFGLARLSEDSLEQGQTLSVHKSAPGSLIGTLAYMSPEQALGRPVSGASDIFSLGLVLYELATGRHPFSAGSALGMLRAITEEVPLPPGRVAPGFAQPVEDLILRMLEKDPNLRPTAEEVASALTQTGWAEPLLRAAGTPAHGTRRPGVGYGKERSELRDALLRAGRAEGGMVCVTGEPGAGKTTLVEDFLAEAEAGGWAVARGRCSERLAGTDGYLPLLEALEGLCRPAAGAPWIRFLRQLAPTWYVQVVSQAGESGERLQAEVKGASQERMKREITSFLQEVTRVKPLLLFFDDLHWADLSTVDVLAYLGDRCRSMRLIILGAYRPTDLLLSKHPFRHVQLELQSRGACREIPLSLLSAADVAIYVESIFPRHDFPPELPLMVHDRTEGNPLFMADLLAYLRDRGVVAEREGDGRWALAEPLSEVRAGLPESVRSMIERKIDRLSEDERRLLAAASVQGSEFDSAALAAALDEDAADIEERLEHLDRVHGFVNQIGETALPDGSVSLRCRFVHVLYQDALYATLGPSRRARISGALARAMVRGHSGRLEPIASRLALLFEAAREWEEAVGFFAMAAQHAAQVSANREALALARRGLDLLERLPDARMRAERELPLQLALSVPLMSLRGYASAEVEAAFSRAMELCRGSEDSIEILQALTGLGAYTLFRPRIDDAVEILERLQRMAAVSPIPGMAGWIHFVAASTLSHAGRMKEALDYGRLCLEASDPAQHLAFIARFGLDPALIGPCQVARIMALSGCLDTAATMVRDGVEKTRKSGHAFTIAFATFFGAMVHAYRSEPAACKALAEEAEGVSREHGFLMVGAWAQFVAGWARAELGEAEAGIGQMELAMEILRTVGSEIFMPEFLGMLAGHIARRDGGAGALQLVEKAQAKAAATGERFYDAELLRLKGALLAGMARHDEAAAAHKAALETASIQGNRLFGLRAAVDRSRALLDQGRPAEARELLAGAAGDLAEGAGTRDLRAARSLLQTCSQRA